MKAFFKPASAGLASINRVELAGKALALAMSSLLGLWHTAAFPQAYPQAHQAVRIHGAGRAA